MPHPEYDPITNKWPGNPKLNAAWATWYYGHPDDDASRYIDLLGEEIATLKAEVERLQILSDESLLRDANLHLMATLQSCQEALRRVVEALEEAHKWIDPAERDTEYFVVKSYLCERIEEALALAKGVMGK